MKISSTTNTSTMVVYIQLSSHVLHFMDLYGFLLSALQPASLFHTILAGTYYKITCINLYRWNWWLKLEPNDVQTPTIQCCIVNYKYWRRNNVVGSSQHFPLKNIFQDTTVCSYEGFLTLGRVSQYELFYGYLLYMLDWFHFASLCCNQTGANLNKLTPSLI